MHSKLCLLAFGFTFLVGPTAIDARAQEHVVSIEELQNDAGRQAEKRRANEAAVRELLSSEAGQKALASTHVQYQQVDTAISQLSDEDLGKIAERSREARNDFAAEGLSSRLLIVIVLIVVLIIVLSVVF